MDQKIENGANMNHRSFPNHVDGCEKKAGRAEEMNYKLRDIYIYIYMHRKVII